jgi:hypothetical protein
MQVPDDEDEAGMLTIRDNRIEVSASRQPFTMSLTTEGGLIAYEAVVLKRMTELTAVLLREKKGSFT